MRTAAGYRAGRRKQSKAARELRCSFLVLRRSLGFEAGQVVGEIVVGKAQNDRSTPVREKRMRSQPAHSIRHSGNSARKSSNPRLQSALNADFAESPQKRKFSLACRKAARSPPPILENRRTSCKSAFFAEQVEGRARVRVVSPEQKEAPGTSALATWPRRLRWPT